jgi:hypothetical protein
MLAYNQARLTLQDKKPIRIHHVRLMKSLLPLQMLFACFGCAIVFGFLAGDPKNDQIYGSLHYLSYFAAVTVLIVHTELVTSPLEAQVQGMRQEGEVSANVEQAIAILSRTRQEFRYNATIQTTINVLMGAVPVLLRKASYQLPLAWFFIGIGVMDVVRHVGKAGVSSGSKSASQESRIKSKDGNVHDATLSVGGHQTQTYTSTA